MRARRGAPRRRRDRARRDAPLTLPRLGLEPLSTNLSCFLTPSIPNPTTQSTPGDHVYMQPAEAGAPLYIARLDALVQAPPGAPPREAASPKGMYAEVAWFYRPEVRARE